MELNHYSSSLQENIDLKIQNLIELLNSFHQKSKIFTEKIAFHFELNQKIDWGNLIQILQELQSIPDLHLSLIEFWADRENWMIYEEWSQYFLQYQTALEEINSKFNKSIHQINSSELARSKKYPSLSPENK